MSRISSKFIGFILLPIITFHYNLEQYGVYVLTDSLFQILWSIFLFGLESGIVRWVIDTKDQLKQKRFLFSVMLFLIVLNTAANLAVFTFRDGLSILVYKSSAYPNLILYASLIATAEALIFVVFLLLRIEEKAKSYSLLSILVSVISLLLQVYFLQYTNNKLEGVFIARIVAPAIVMLITLPYLLRHISFGYEKLMLKELIIYSFPIMAGSIVITLLNQIDRYILGYLSGMNDVGIYGLASNISGFLNFLIVSPFSLAFTVLSWKKLKDDNAQRFYTKTLTYLFLAVTYSAIIVSLFTPHLIKVFTLRTDYWAASKFVPWLAISVSFYGIHFVGVFSFYVSKKTKYVLISYLISMFAKIVLDFALIPQFGLYGACAANLLSFVILNLSIYIFSRSNYFFKYEWVKILLMFVCYFAVTVPFFAFKLDNRVIEILLKFAAFGLYPLLLYLLRFYEPIEIESVKKFAIKYILRKAARV